MKLKKLRLTPLSGLLALCIVVIIAPFVWLAQPGVMESTSPNGQLVARVIYPSVLSILIDPEDKNRDLRMRVRIQITDKSTGENVEASNNPSASLLGDYGEDPEKLTWHPDNKQLTYTYRRPPARKRRVFQIARRPLKVQQISDVFAD